MNQNSKSSTKKFGKVYSSLNSNDIRLYTYNNNESQSSIINRDDVGLKYSGLTNFYNIKPQIPPTIGANEVYNSQARKLKVCITYALNLFECN